MNKDQMLLEEAYQSILESSKEPLYFGPQEKKDSWLRWLTFMKNVTIHGDGSLSIDDNVTIVQGKLKKLPFKFKEIGGFFSCGGNDLETLEGCPEIVKGSFNCSINNLEDLRGAPKSVSGSFNCSNNKELNSLEGAPEVINGSFMCSSCNFSTLKGAPKTVKGDFECYRNDLISLEGAPEKIEGKFVNSKFSDDDYRSFIKKRKHVDKNLSKEFDIDLEDF